jgi:NTE family protein
MRIPNDRTLTGTVKNLKFGTPGRILRGGLCWALLILMTTGCVSYGVIHNEAGIEPGLEPPYSLKSWADQANSGDFVLILAFSGGGTRAAAMAYGVLQELRDQPIVVDGQNMRLLDEVDHISSVSGGSFTSAYYGLYGDRIFSDFETEFLRKNVQGHLTRSLFLPWHWFGRKGRTERAVDYYNKILFHDATFADMMQPGRPMIVINASDLSHGFRFSFIQDYFNLLCTDLRSFPVATAVTASSAVPVVFNPIVVENYPGCDEHVWPVDVLEQAKTSDELRELIEGMASYSDKENRKYVHFVDGGITDNIGLRAITDIMLTAGGPEALVSKMQRKVSKRVVFVSVNASTTHSTEMDESPKQPHMIASMNAMTDAQLHRYNAATIDFVRGKLSAWAAELSTAEHTVEPYFIEMSFEDVAQPQLKLFLNKIPTSFSLEKEQVDALISSSRSLLSDNPEYQRLLKDLANP